MDCGGGRRSDVIVVSHRRRGRNPCPVAGLEASVMLVGREAGQRLLRLARTPSVRFATAGGLRQALAGAPRNFGSSSSPAPTGSTGSRLERAFEEVSRASRREDASGEDDTRRQQPRGARSALHTYGRDLTRDAELGALDPLIGREDVLQRVLRVLMRRTKNNAVLVGEAGVGKTAVAEGVAQLLASASPPPGFRGKRMFSLDAGSLVAGTQYRGAFEERLQAVLNEVRAANGNILLFVDELHMLVNAGRTDGSMDAANLLKPALARGELHCLGATTPDEYRRHIESDPAFARRFQAVHVEEPSVEEAALWLRGLRDRYERHHQVEVLESAIDAAARCAKRYLPHRRLPDSAIDILDEAAASARLCSSRAGAARPWSPEMRTGSKGHIAAQGLASGNACWDREATSGNDSNEQLHASEWGGDVQFVTSQPPRPCPHCAMPVRWQPKQVVQIQCPACNFRFLNLPPEQLMLGSTVAGPLAVDGPGAHIRVAVIERDNSRDGAPPRGPEQGAASIEGRKLVIPDENPRGETAMRRRLDEWARATQGPNLGEPNGFSEDESQVSGEHVKVGEEDVLQVVSLMTGVPLGEMAGGEQSRLADLQRELSKEVIGQNAAVQAVVAAVHMGRLGIRPAGRPLCSFLFAGPAGVGKTLLAETLAAHCYKDPAAVVRLNGNDLAERASISRLLGPPPGYVGYGQGGELTEPVRRRPHSLIIVDSADAAHPEVQELLAQVVETGRLTDSTGRVADFTNAILILTTRLRSRTRAESGGAEAETRQQQDHPLLQRQVAGGGVAVHAAVEMPAVAAGPRPSRRQSLVPELLSRVDETVFLEDLGPDELMAISHAKVCDAVRQAMNAGVSLRVAPEVTEAIAKGSFELGQGARPVAQMARRHILAPLAQELVSRGFPMPKGPGSPTTCASIAATVQLAVHPPGRAQNGTLLTKVELVDCTL